MTDAHQLSDKYVEQRLVMICDFSTLIIQWQYLLPVCRAPVYVCGCLLTNVTHFLKSSTAIQRAEALGKASMPVSHYLPWRGCR